MKNLMKLVITFVVLVILIAGIGTVVLNWTGHQELLPPALQDPPVAEQPADIGATTTAPATAVDVVVEKK